MRTLRILLYGLLAGVLLSLMRAPGGLDLVHAPVADASTRMAFRGAALLVIGLSLGRPARLFARGVPGALLLLAVTAGFALHGLWLEAFVQPDSRTGFGLALAVLALALALLARGSASDAAAGPAGATSEGGGAGAQGDVPNGLAAPGPGPAERLAYALAGAGAAIAIEGLSRPARLFAMGLAQDETAFALAFLLVATLLGGLAFGAPLAASPRARSLAVLGLACVPALVRFEAGYVANLVDPAGFETWLHAWRTDTARMGTWFADVPLALRMLSGPAFAVGATVGLCRDHRRLSALLVGAAIGTFVVPWAAGARSITAETAFANTPTAALIGAGWIACLAPLLLAGARGLGRGTRVALVAGAVVALVPFLALRGRPAQAILPLAPQDVFEVQPLVAIDAPIGLLTVEVVRFGSVVATLDRHRLTATQDELAGDALRIRESWALLPAERRASGEARVLFIGQVDPDRERVLASLGAGRVDRTAPWFDSMPELEEALFRDSGTARDEIDELGDAVPPGEARARLRRGEYDLAIVAPLVGPTPRPKSVTSVYHGRGPDVLVGGLEAPEGGVAVVWLDGRDDLAGRDLGERVVLASGGPEDLSVGVVLGEPAEGALTFPAGEPERGTPAWKRLLVWPLRREYGARADLARRLARASAGTPLEAAARGLALHFAAQRPSSPFESSGERVEVDPDALALLRDAALAHPSDPFLHELWNHLAALLVEKRMPDLVLADVEPLATAQSPWPQLERAVGRAYEEFAMPETAAPWLERALESQPYDIALLVQLAGVLLRAGDAEGAVARLREALALQPGRPDIERWLGMALVRAGDPAGVPLIEAALEREPDDPELRAYLEPGPLPPLESDFRIRGDVFEH